MLVTHTITWRFSWWHSLWGARGRVWHRPPQCKCLYKGPSESCSGMLCYSSSHQPGISGCWPLCSRRRTSCPDNLPPARSTHPSPRQSAELGPQTGRGHRWALRQPGHIWDTQPSITEISACKRRESKPKGGYLLTVEMENRRWHPTDPPLSYTSEFHRMPPRFHPGHTRHRYTTPGRRWLPSPQLYPWSSPPPSPPLTPGPAFPHQLQALHPCCPPGHTTLSPALWSSGCAWTSAGPARPPSAGSHIHISWPSPHRTTARPGSSRPSQPHCLLRQERIRK